MASVAKIASSLSNTEGVCLRYVTSTVTLPVEPGRIINHIEWSPMPHSYLEAKKALEGLLAAKLVKRVGRKAFAPTEFGGKVIAHADKKGLFRVPLVPNPSSRRNF